MRRTRKRITRPGHLDTQVIVYKQDPDAEANEDGQIPETELEVCRPWVELMPMRGRLQPLPGTTEANISHVLRMPYTDKTDDITTDYWLEVVATGVRLNIEAVIDIDNLHQWLELECTERET